MSGINCNNPKNQQERSFCDCEKAVKNMTTQISNYEKRYKTYQADLQSYNRWKQRHEDWKNLRGHFQRFGDLKNNLRNERRNWNNCVAWNETNAGKHNDWCQNDVGQGWYHTGQDGGGCSLGFGKGVCGRTDEEVDRVMADSLKKVEPTADPLISSKKWLGMGEPVQPLQPPSSDILCCSQIFSDINVQDADMNISDINQDCGKRLSEQRNNPSSSALASSINTLSSQSVFPTNTSSATSDSAILGLDRNMFIIIIVIVFLSLIFSIIGATLLTSK
jgi:hypothetical protein